MNRIVTSFVIAAFVTVTPLGAQVAWIARSDEVTTVPPEYLPPAGFCRVWIDGVPPRRQPAPTSCARAERERSTYGRNARVVYGEHGALRRTEDADRRGDWRDDDWRDDRRRGERERRFVDASGRVCTERTVYKKNGDRKSTIDCKAPRGSQIRRVRDDRYESATLPSMIDAVIFSRGSRSEDVVRWLGSGSYHVRYTDLNADGRPEQATWLDAGGRTLQQWIDGNRDGRADVVRVYENGQLVRVIRDE